MEHSNEPSILKILIDVSEYERLKHIEAKYIEIQHSTPKSENQIGKGDDIGQTSLLIPPTVGSEFVEETKFNPIHYNVPVNKSDLNSTFDEKRLLTFVPKNHIKTAKFLLKEFEKRGDELTWNSSGTIFIQKIALPGSNIFNLFPLLFKKKL